MSQARHIGILAERFACGQQQSADIRKKQEHGGRDPSQALSVILSNI